MPDINANQSADSTRVFRIPLDDATAPDLLKSTVIEDLGSPNGTWVDGAIVNSAPLHDGSSVQIGTFTLVYHESLSERIETGE